MALFATVFRFDFLHTHSLIIIILLPFCGSSTFSHYLHYLCKQQDDIKLVCGYLSFSFVIYDLQLVRLFCAFLQVLLFFVNVWLLLLHSIYGAHQFSWRILVLVYFFSLSVSFSIFICCSGHRTEKRALNLKWKCFIFWQILLLSFLLQTR